MEEQNDLFAELLTSPSAQEPKTVSKYSRYAQVAVQTPVDRPFTYGIPDAMDATIRVGSIVTVPFGAKNLPGAVIAIETELPPEVPLSKIRAIKQIRTPDFHIDQYLIDLAYWIADETLSSLGDTLACLSFIGFADTRSSKEMFYTLTKEFVENRELPKRLGKTMKAVISAMLAKTPTVPITATQIANACGTKVTRQTLKRLEELGIIESQIKIKERPDEYEKDIGTNAPPPTLTAEQVEAIDKIHAAMTADKGEVFVLQGVTGSGKTEIYLQAIQKALDMGGTAICLVPEISLTPQAVERFRNRFGDTVGVYHSRLSIGQKYDLWQRVKQKRCRVMIGARSALFTPFDHLKVLILDEEHESSYKQDSTPRYHSREVAAELARRLDIPLILGSATPSIETYYRAKTGVWTLLTLTQRIDGQPLPQVEVINMSRELLLHPEHDILSENMVNAIKGALDAHQMTILFLNRRGFYTIIRCSKCGAILQCDNCEVPLTYHKNSNVLKCHYCEQQYAPSVDCPHCVKEGIHRSMVAIGIGTQRIEETVAKLFPQARIKRMDFDTTRSKNAYVEAWSEISGGKVDILIGTQMIARGLHIENVTVVGVPLADVTLFQPDYRSTERTFSLLTQVAGRAGRGKEEGKVYIQTYAPHNYAIGFAQKHDYNGFYEREIKLRRLLYFPPFTKLCSVLATGLDNDQVNAMITEFSRIIRARLWEDPTIKMKAFGPNPASIAKIENTYRYRLLLRGEDPAEMRAILRHALTEFEQVPGHQQVRLTIDFDPYDLL